MKFSSPNVPRTLPQDYEGYAVSFFLSSYILLPKDPEIRRSFLDCLYPVWVQAGTASPLRPAVTAVASCRLETWSKLKPDLPLSLSHSQYVKGVVALRKSLKSNIEVNDDVLLAALMLDMYEQLRSFWGSKRNDSPHVNGIAALIENRRRLPFASEITQRVFLGARNQIVGRALSNVQPVPANISRWADVTHDVSKTAGFRLDNLSIELANLQAAASRLNSESKVENDFLLGVLTKAAALDKQLLAWTSTVPNDLAPIRVAGSQYIPQSVRDAGLYQEHCDIYKSVFVANMFNSQCCSRIKLQLMILTCLKQLKSSNFTTASITPLEIIQTLADNICAAVPFYLGDRMTATRIDDKTVRYPRVADPPVSDDHRVAAAAYGGWFIVGRLSELLSPNVPLRDGQKKWMETQMHRVRRIYVINPSS